MTTAAPTPDPAAAASTTVVTAPDPAAAADDPREGRLSIFAAILLGVAATLTALSAYQAALTDGEALAGYSDANAGLTASTFLYNTQFQTLAEDQALFVEYASANYEGNADLADYLYTLMSPNLQESVDWFNESDTAVTPFEDGEGNPYTGTDFSDGDQVIDEAEKSYDAGSAADEKGDKFELASVLLALCLFFAGIATLFRRRSVIAGLLVFATVLLFAGTGQMLVGFAA